MTRRRGTEYITRRKVGRRRRYVMVRKLPDGRETVQVLRRQGSGDSDQARVPDGGLSVETPLAKVRVGEKVVEQPMEYARFTEATAAQVRRERRLRKSK